MMEEEMKKFQEQQQIEKENYEIIESVIDILAKAMSAKQYYQLIKLISESKREIYELKIKLGEKIPEAYARKDGKKLTKLLRFATDMSEIEPLVSIHPIVWEVDKFKELCRISIIRGEYPIYTTTREILDISKSEEHIVKYDITRLTDKVKCYDMLISVDDKIRLSYYGAHRFLRYDKPDNTFLQKVIVMEDTVKDYAKGNKYIEDKFLEVCERARIERKDETVVKCGKKIVQKLTKIEKETIKSVNLKISNDIIQYMEREKFRISYGRYGSRL